MWPETREFARCVWQWYCWKVIGEKRVGEKEEIMLFSPGPLQVKRVGSEA